MNYKCKGGNLDRNFVVVFYEAMRFDGQGGKNYVDVMVDARDQKIPETPGYHSNLHIGTHAKKVKDEKGAWVDAVDPQTGQKEYSNYQTYSDSQMEALKKAAGDNFVRIPGKVDKDGKQHSDTLVYGVKGNIFAGKNGGSLINIGLGKDAQPLSPSDFKITETTLQDQYDFMKAESERKKADLAKSAEAEKTEKAAEKTEEPKKKATKAKTSKAKGTKKAPEAEAKSAEAEPEFD